MTSARAHESAREVPSTFFSSALSCPFIYPSSFLFWGFNEFFGIQFRYVVRTMSEKLKYVGVLKPSGRIKFTTSSYLKIENTNDSLALHNVMCKNNLYNIKSTSVRENDWQRGSMSAGKSVNSLIFECDR